MSDSPAAVLYDSSGNAVAVVQDEVIYRLRMEGKVAKNAVGNIDYMRLNEARGLKTTLYTPDGDPVTFGAIPPNPESIKNEFVEESGGGTSLLVDGSTTSVVFTYDADPSNDISLQELGFVMASNSVKFGTDDFGRIGGPLTNGLLIEITSDGNTGTLGVLKQNEDFVHFASPGGFEWVVSSKDMMSSVYLIGGGLKLKAGTGDNVKVTVRDDIDACARYFKCFVKGHTLGT